MPTTGLSELSGPSFSDKDANAKKIKTSRLLRRKIPQSGHLMLPRRLWMQTVPTQVCIVCSHAYTGLYSLLSCLHRSVESTLMPTQGCEVVIQLSSTANDDAVTWLTKRLKSRIPELVLTVKTTSTASQAIYLCASIDGLVKGAEDLRLFKNTKPEFGSGRKEVTSADLAMFEGVEDLGSFFTGQERHTIVQYLLNSLRANEEDMDSVVPLRLGEAIISKWKSAGVIDQVFPLHDRVHLCKLQNSWVQTFFRYQPLDAIHDYFGDKIAIYFAWLGCYTASLVFPAVIGVIFWLNFWGHDQAVEDKAFVALAFLNAVWGSVWLEAWKRRNAELSHRWGLPAEFHDLLQEPRPQFKGELRLSPVTGRLEPWFPTWRRNVFRYCVTLPLVIVCLLTVFVLMLLILKTQDYVDALITSRGWPGLLSWGPKLLMAVAMSTFDEVNTRVAVWLNDHENYRANETYHNHLIAKLALFRFVNSFLALFYIAFYLQDMERLKEQLAALLLVRQIVGNIKESCVPYFMEQLRLAKLSFDLFGALSPSQEVINTWPADQSQCLDQRIPDNEGTSLMKTDTCHLRMRQVSGAGNDISRSTPGISQQADGISQSVTTISQQADGVSQSATAISQQGSDKQVAEGSSAELSRSSSKSRIVSQADVESDMKPYDGTFEDYLEMLIQFGYVMLFSSAFPPAAVCAFLNNIIEIRSDAFKLCCVFQRPFPQRVASIGVWQDAMEFLGLLGIIVNCMLIGQSGQVHRMFPDMTTTQTILLIIVLEHAMVALKYAISYAIPDVPEWVAEQEAKVEFQRREALRRASFSPPTADTSQPPSPKNHSYCPRLPAGKSSTAKSNSTGVAEESPTDSAPLKPVRPRDEELLKKFGIPDFSQLKRQHTTDALYSRKVHSQETPTPKKLPTTPESFTVSDRKLPFFESISSFKKQPMSSDKISVKKASSEYPSSKKTPSTHTEMKIFHDNIPEIPSFGGSKLRRSNSSIADRSAPIAIPKSASKHGMHPETTLAHSPFETSSQSAPADVEKKKRQFNFTPEAREPILEESPRMVKEVASGSSSSHSVSSTVGSPSHSGPRHVAHQSQPQLYHQADRHAIEHPAAQAQQVMTPKKNFPSVESLPPESSQAQNQDANLPVTQIDSSSPKIDPLKRKPPNKFLKRAQSFSQFLKKKPTLPERRKKSGDASRDDYYLPTSHEQLEEPQGEMMLVPVEKLVSIDDLACDRREY
ncbi:Anoctamin [Trinorchestia longiramus]|nr:Anoctamin [Trinorchestia longiramus]